MPGVLRFLSPLLHPVGLAWALLLVGAVVSFRRKRILGGAVCSVAAAALWALAQEPIMGPIYRPLEHPWLQATVEQAGDADAVIVLGGGWRGSASETWKLDRNDCVDRLVTGIELCRRGRAPVLVLGGDSPRQSPGEMPDSERIRAWLSAWNLAPKETLSLGPVSNTHEEALSARSLVERRGWRRVLLVTSAFHMGRALATFRQAGVPAEPVACDFRFDVTRMEKDPRWCLCPDETALLRFSIWWHEWLGHAAYLLLGRT